MKRLADGEILTYETFRKVGGEWPNGIWEYCGHCFRGETVERGIEPYHI
jgi:hypothetical protein